MRNHCQLALIPLLFLFLLPQINSIQLATQDKLDYPQEEIVVEVHGNRMNHHEDTFFEISINILEEENIQQQSGMCSEFTSNDISSCLESSSKSEVELFQDEEAASAVYLHEVTELKPTPALEIPCFEPEIHISPTQYVSIVPAVEIYLCPPSPVENCVPKYQGVCATYNQNCPNNDCRETFENECSACINPDIHTYAPGACPPDPVQCDPNNRPDSCDDNVQPVCGAKVNCVSSCNVSFRNKCHACFNPQIVAYTPGTCPSETFPSSPIKFCEPDRAESLSENTTMNFVCSHFKDCISEGCSITSLNSQTACANPSIDYFTSGKCQEDFQITAQSASVCQPHQSTAPCGNTFDPVCAHFKDSTRPDSATKTFLNQCLACDDINIEFLVSGACKNEQILMESFCDVNHRPMMCPIGGVPVCGHKIDCNDGNCQETFSSDCFACGKDYISSYLSGECSQQGTQTQKIYCDPKSRPQSCGEGVIKQAQPVCGVYSATFNGSKNKTFETSCAACQNPEVQFYLTQACTEDSDDNLAFEEF